MGPPPLNMKVSGRLSKAEADVQQHCPGCKLFLHLLCIGALSMLSSSCLSFLGGNMTDALASIMSIILASRNQEGHRSMPAMSASFYWERKSLSRSSAQQTYSHSLLARRKLHDYFLISK